ncbi:MAG: cell division protein FtsZ, partial [Rhodoferax sp.]|nr:cell division protein FtsZ [Rhodoferax sp.]
TPDFPDMLEEVARARELDQFASGHDAQLGFTLRASNTAWSPGYVQQHAARLGFVPGVLPGRMVLASRAAAMPPVLTLSFDTQAALAEDPAQAAIREVSLALDVAQVDRAEQAFVRLREAANALALAMDGVITDDNGQMLPRDAMDLIGSELESLYDTLEQRDLAAGSALARRLFS